MNKIHQFCFYNHTLVIAEQRFSSVEEIQTQPVVIAMHHIVSVEQVTFNIDNQDVNYPKVILSNNVAYTLITNIKEFEDLLASISDKE